MCDCDVPCDSDTIYFHSSRCVRHTYGDGVVYTQRGRSPYTLYKGRGLCRRPTTYTLRPDNSEIMLGQGQTCPGASKDAKVTSSLTLLLSRFVPVKPSKDITRSLPYTHTYTFSVNIPIYEYMCVGFALVHY